MLVIVMSVLASCGSGAAAPVPAHARARLAQSAARLSPCGRSRPHAYHHVIWVWMENRSYSSVIGSPSGTFQASLGKECGLATNYHGVSHPSLPNYLAATGGSTFGVTDDGGPGEHPISAPSLFADLRAHGRTWASYEASMPAPCWLTSQGLYAPKHNPAAYYVRIRSACRRYDVPMGSLTSGAFHRALAHGDLPSFSFVTPNLCDDAHNCSTATGDGWLAKWVAAIVRSPAYRAGSTVLFIVYDEGAPGNQVPAIVVSPSTRPGTRSATYFNHYSLLRTAEDLLGVPPVGRSGRSVSMAKAFGL
jgi:hypothetical protein